MIKRLLIGALLMAGLGVLAMVAFGVVGGRGAHNEWEQLRASLESEGIRTEWAEIIPDAVSEEDNYFAHPVVREWIPGRAGRVKVAESPAQPPFAPPAFPPQIEGVDVPFSLEWLRSLPAKGTNGLSLQALESWFSRWDPALSGLIEASQRPHAVMPGDYSYPVSMPGPNAAAVRNAAQFIGSRARLNFVAGRPKAALENIKSLEALLRAVNTRPAVTVDALLYNSLLPLYVELVRDGLREDAWTEAELMELHAALRKAAPLAHARLALIEGEIAGMGKLVAESGIDGNPRNPKVLRKLHNRMRPRRWIRQNQLKHAAILKLAIDAYDPEKPALSLSAHSKAMSEFKQLMANRGAPGSMIAAYSLPNMDKLAHQSAHAQALVNHAAIACALQAHKLRHGRYPQSLSELATPMPPDSLTGQSPSYIPTPAGFLLYSLGSNLQDDGGTERLDWVWKSGSEAELLPGSKESTQSGGGYLDAKRLLRP